MKKPTLGRKSSRHPAVIDLLGGTPTGDVPPVTPTGGAVPGGPVEPVPTAARRTRGPSGGRRPYVKIAAAIGMAAAIVSAVVVANDQVREDNLDPAQAAMAAAAPTDENGLPMLNLPEPERVEVPETTGDGECRADRGDQKSGAGVIAAFNYAYYSQRNGDAARALAMPTSSVLPAPELQKFIDAVPVGTNYCIRTIKLSDGVYLVDLSLMKPGQPVDRGTQTVTTQKTDGRWFVDVFK
ncbi:hypothetical protein [Rhodococcus jostii]|uniref:hypothetical protein n=1 Tax=Rhodococcus jostii TaxID=132919 RepID=UPI00365740B4